jgi:SulP family sulfate permease
MLIVAFVGLLTILLSVASLELTYQREFELESVLRAHAGVAVVSGALGGFTGVISIGRTALNRQMGGGAISATIAGVICLATLMGGGGAITYIPKAALGGLVLFIGIGMLRQWLWDQRTKTTAVELSQILLIVGLVAKFGFLVGFAAGILIACVVFVVTYSRIPVTGLSTTLANFPSTVVRPDHEAALLHDRGHGVLVYRLHGYMFFGSASAIDAAFRSLDKSVTGVIIDFSDVSGVDSSAVGVFQRILRRFQHRETPFAFVYSPSVERGVRAIISGFAIASAHSSLDSALEAAEERIVSGAAESEGRLFSFLPDAESRQAFAAHCERRTLRRGETLCLEGDHSAEVFFVDQGSLEVFKQGDNGNGLRLAKLRAGAMVGEQAFYTGEARTASIAAAEDSIVYALGHEELERLRRTHPEVAQAFDRMVITKLSHALARTNRLVAGFR